MQPRKSGRTLHVVGRHDRTHAYEYDVVIIGAGVCGTALLYLLRKYTSIRRIAIVEKEPEVGRVNSAVMNNSQTLHFGDIETNYGLERSRQVKAAAERVRRYLDRHDPQGEMHSVYSKMVLAVGRDQVEQLEARHQQYRELFPNLRRLDREALAELEPCLVEGRKPEEELLALQTDRGYTVDFGALSRSFFERAKAEGEGSEQAHDRLSCFFDTTVRNLERVDSGYRIHTRDGRTLTSRAVAVQAGAYSLWFAKQLGLGKDAALLSVAGSFFTARRKLRGKVYTMQIKQLPFAAVHGDPEVHEPSVTRFGPTAKPLPLLERHNYATLIDYLRTVGLRLAALLAFFRILARPIVFRYAFSNALYDIPWLGRLLFARKVRRIVPTLSAGELHRARGYGGVRPQIVDVQNKELNKGEQKLYAPGAIFNVTPSPGASVCLQSAMEDADTLTRHLGARFDREAFERDLGETSSETSGASSPQVYA